MVEGAIQGTATALKAARLAGLLAYDELLLLGMRRFHGPWRTRVAKVFTYAGDGRSWAIAGVALTATGRQTGALLALRIGVGSTLGALAAQVLKRTLNRARPTRAIAGFQALAEDPDAFSFPSGHTAAAVAFATGAGREWPIVGIPLHGLAALVGYSRVHTGVHYPGDVVAGALIGAVVADLVGVPVDRRRSPRGAERA